MNKRKKIIEDNIKNLKSLILILSAKFLEFELAFTWTGYKKVNITTAIGFLTTLLGLIIWTNLKPFIWLIEMFRLMTGLTSVFPVSILGPLIFIIGLY